MILAVATLFTATATAYVEMAGAFAGRNWRRCPNILTCHPLAWALAATTKPHRVQEWPVPVGLATDEGARRAASITLPSPDVANVIAAPAAGARLHPLVERSLLTAP